MAAAQWRNETAAAMASNRAPTPLPRTVNDVNNVNDVQKTQLIVAK
jgi:hypothetical protein